jgi:hypothetical protein
MACNTILRGVFLPVTSETRPHVMRNGTFSNCRLCHVSMTRRARDTSPVMRRVAELYVSIFRKTIDSLPRNLNVFLRVTNDLPNFGSIGRDLCVAEHAFSNRGKTRSVAVVSANVAIGTGQADFSVNVVRKRDGLLRSAYRAQSE